MKRIVHYRRLTPEFVRFLDGTEASGKPCWPAYRPLKSYSISTYSSNRDWAFAEREYKDLKIIHVGRSELVTALVNYLGEFERETVMAGMPALGSRPTAHWLDHLTEFCDGRLLRGNDYYRKATWKELPLVWALKNDADLDRSYCRDEETAKRIAHSQYVEIGKSLVSAAEWRKQNINHPAIAERCGDTTNEFMGLVARFWRAIPECVWLLHKRNKLIGGSVVLPLTEHAYESLRSGSLGDEHLDPEVDLQLPSRHLFVIAMTVLPEIPKPKLPGLRTAFQFRKAAQHCAVLIGDDRTQDEPVRLLAALGSTNDEKAVERLGYTPLHRNQRGTQCPMYELVIPAPESTLADYSTASTTIATLIGTQWRLMQRASTAVATGPET